MAVTSCSIHKKQSSFRSNENTHTVWYRITTDSNADPNDVFFGAQSVGPNTLPGRGEQHPQDLTAFVLSVDVQHRHPNDFKQWEAIVQYGEPPQQGNQEDPLSWDVNYRIDFKLVSRIVTEDYLGQPLLNTARDTIASPPRLDYQVPILIAEKNYATLDEIVQLGQQFSRTSNSLPWFGAQAGQAQFEGVRAGEQQTWNNIDYYPAVVSIAIDYFATATSTTLVDNLGWRAWDEDPGWVAGGSTIDENGNLIFQPAPGWTDREAGNTATLERIIADNGEPLTAPVYLTGEGKQPSGGAPTVYKIEYDLLRRVDYTNIGIGG